MLSPGGLGGGNDRASNENAPLHPSEHPSTSKDILYAKEAPRDEPPTWRRLEQWKHVCWRRLEASLETPEDIAGDAWRRLATLQETPGDIAGYAWGRLVTLLETPGDGLRHC